MELNKKREKKSLSNNFILLLMGLSFFPLFCVFILPCCICHDNENLMSLEGTFLKLAQFFFFCFLNIWKTIVFGCMHYICKYSQRVETFIGIT